MQNEEKIHFYVHILVYMDFFLYLCALNVFYYYAKGKFY